MDLSHGHHEVDADPRSVICWHTPHLWSPVPGLENQTQRGNLLLGRCCKQLLQRSLNGAGEKTQRPKGLATQPDCLSLIPGTHLAEGEN